jgi:hypothetical protein
VDMLVRDRCRSARVQTVSLVYGARILDAVPDHGCSGIWSPSALSTECLHTMHLSPETGGKSMASYEGHFIITLLYNALLFQTACSRLFRKSVGADIP